MTSRRGVLWPLVLIAAGVLFLAANFGYLSVNPAAVIALWPLVLVLIGIDVAFAHRWPVATIVAEVAVIAGGFAVVVAQPVLPAWWVGAPGGDTSVSAPRNGAQSLTLHVDGGAGRFTVHGGATELVEATADQPRLTLRRTDRGGGAVDVRVDQSDGSFHFAPGQPMTVDVAVASDAPTTLDVNAGAGDFTVDLSDIQLRDARFSVGAASLVLVLPHPKGEVPITVSGAASSLTIRIPSGVEAQVTMTGALTSLRSENDRFSGNATGGYASAADRVTVKITGAASSVVIR